VSTLLNILPLAAMPKKPIYNPQQTHALQGILKYNTTIMFTIQ
jgi:hypothetical protein